MTKNKPSVRDILHEFAEDTSAHGAIKISSAKSIFWRLFWILVSLACLGMVIYQGILLLNTFLDKPTKSDIDVTYIRVSSTADGFSCFYVGSISCKLNIFLRGQNKASIQQIQYRSLQSYWRILKKNENVSQWYVYACRCKEIYLYNFPTKLLKINWNSPYCL